MQSIDRGSILLEKAVRVVVQKLEDSLRNGTCNPSNGWILGYLEMALELSELVRSKDTDTNDLVNMLDENMHK